MQRIKTGLVPREQSFLDTRDYTTLVWCKPLPLLMQHSASSLASAMVTCSEE